MIRSLAVAVLSLVATLALVLVMSTAVVAQAPTNLNDFFLPGSQPGESGNLETPQKCDNCHGGYDLTVEPAFNWRGSMMAQAARDPLFHACLAIANQDAPDSGDLCIRCHSPAGWLEGRSLPTDGSALNNNDRESVQCDFCHKLVKPTELGLSPFPNDPDYMLGGTYDADQSYLASLLDPPFESANGMYIADSSGAKRGPFVDAVARHKMYYSPFHKEAALCGTCHDVSNPAFTHKRGDGSYAPNAFKTASDSFSLRDMFPIERTYSEWSMSAYNTETGVYAPQFAGNKPDGMVSTCQDCHMRDVRGVGCNKKGAPTREDLPLHDLTGGNTTMPKLVSLLYPEEVNTQALDLGVGRALSMLQLAATMELNVVIATGEDGIATVRVTNETGHKLPSGYPEGRRIWINLKAYDSAGSTVYESGAYNFGTAELTEDGAAKIYEVKPGISEDVASEVGRPAGIGFHFVLNNKIFKDNRIPPRGFTNTNFEIIQSPSVPPNLYEDGQYWDETDYVIPATAERVTATLYYQTTSKEYVEFLRDKNETNEWGQVFYDLWAANGKSAPEVMATATWPPPAADEEAPTTPTNLVATAAGKSSIDLTWSASTDNVGVVGYEINRDGVLLTEVSEINYRDSGLASGQTYAYQVRAFDAAGNFSPLSNEASATTETKGGGGKPNK